MCVSLVGLSACHSSLPTPLLHSSSFQLSTSLLALSRGPAENTQKNTPCLPAQRPSAPTTCLWKGGSYYPKPVPWVALGPQVSRKVFNPTLPGIFKWPCAGSLPPQFIQAQGSPMLTAKLQKGLTPNLLSPLLHLTLSSIPNNRASVMPFLPTDSSQHSWLETLSFLA